MDTLTCDFCGDVAHTDDLMILPVDRFHIPALNYWNFSWGWGGCAGCATLLRDKDWLGLLERAIANHPSGERARLPLAHVYLGLVQHTNGPLRKWQPGLDDQEDET